MMECARFESLLGPLLEHDLDAAADAEAVRHRAACPRCQELWNQATDAEQRLRAWEAPVPRRGFAARVLGAAARAPLCERVLENLDPLLDDDLEPAAARRLLDHAASCPGCARRIDEARRVDALIRSTDVAPLPPPALAARILEAARDQGLVRRAAPRPIFARPALRFALAAAVLVSATFLLDRVAGLGAGSLGPALLPRDPKAPVVSVEDAVERFGGRARLLSVMNSQYPAGIGSFDSAPMATERRAPANRSALLHSLRSLREAQWNRAAAGSGDEH